ncbi:MAG: Asp23/Gls24 family envelope stress response protein [Actinomycetales bacterium]|nr:stress protein, Gls24 family [Aeromicrobium sp. Leaf245]KQP29386.1 stress protein, Gls24 family [Aeromicrobium sp. Leaf272]KQP75676.1 stress protein, Gls24 family [Aeromicrobium sp. Leaf289]KQP81742.1 stress protein, Gls24 family [Aeromicrobium sp. Leaf291]RYY43739.1 MAG: Asp23/Gls24 family envelope stress response protein [Actinomycetales bacterium]
MNDELQNRNDDVSEKAIAKTTTTSSELESTQGRTTIADTVVSKIAGIATREVTGVYALGGGTARAVGALRERIPGSSTNHSQGISVEVGEKEAAIDIQLVAEYGVSIADLAKGIRTNVINAVERMVGLSVVEVNIEVQDIHIEADESADDSTSSEPRVQ